MGSKREGEKDFRCDFEKVETEMDAALHIIIEMLTLPAFKDFYLKNLSGDSDGFVLIVQFLKGTRFRVVPQDKKQAQIECVRQTSHKVVNLVGEIVERTAGSSTQSSTSGSHDLVKDWSEIEGLIYKMMVLSDWPFSSLIKFGDDGRFLESEIIEKMLLETADCSHCRRLNMREGMQLLMWKAIPALQHTSSYIIYRELTALAWLITRACEEKPLAILLIGGLLSLKPIGYDTWNQVKDDLSKIKESKMWHIINYCYDDLPYFLKQCFLYFACYPIGCEVPATSLTNIWIAEGFATPGERKFFEFVPPEKEETREEIANKYLEELVQRSLIFVSKRSFLGTIKSFRVPHLIHEFAIQQAYMNEFLVANPDKEKITSQYRVAIYHDDEKQDSIEVKNKHLLSLLAFNLQTNFREISSVLLRVLELRKSTTHGISLSNKIHLKYLGLRGSNISELPKNLGDMKYLQTLDVRDTNIKTLPESLWNIETLRNVYVEPNPQIKGPPSTANISDLQILKTIEAHDSWQENIPHFLIHLRKLALSNLGNLDWKSISNLLSHMDKLISMAIMGNIIPSEFADIRAFQNLKTIKSIKLLGKWSFRKLPIDNVEFPPNLTKLNLTKSGLKKDPMRALERLQALKFLSLKDGAYKGSRMVCSAHGFPKLQFLELEKLENLENLEVEWVMVELVKKMGFPQLTTLRVVQCRKLNHLPNLDHNIDIVTD
ncbi:putative disease resistance protein At1g59780 [Carex rostrata]